MKVAMLFPGYGSQYVGMGKEIYDASREMQEFFEEASQCVSINFVKLCFASSETELSHIRNAYTSIFLVSAGISRIIQAAGIIPSLVAGYNQGEFSAAYAAGAITFPDGLYLLSKYALFYEQFLQENQVAAIRVQGITQEIIEEICFKVTTQDSYATIGIFESSMQFIVTGHAPAIEQARAMLSGYADAIITEVSVHVGMHSSIVASVSQQFKMYLEKVDFQDTQIGMVSASQAGHVITTGGEYKENAGRHIESAMHWSSAIEMLQVYDIIMAVGPGTSLLAELHLFYPDKKIITINSMADIERAQLIMTPG